MKNKIDGVTLIVMILTGTISYTLIFILLKNVGVKNVDIIKVQMIFGSIAIILSGFVCNLFRKKK